MREKEKPDFELRANGFLARGGIEAGGRPGGSLIGDFKMTGEKQLKPLALALKKVAWCVDRVRVAPTQTYSAGLQLSFTT